MPQGNKQLRKLTRKVVATFTDAVLASLFYGLEFATASRGSRFWEATQKSFDDLSAFNYETISRALTQLKKKGLVQTLKEASREPQITEAGRKRLESVLPKYDRERIWDGVLYLVTYDIPVEHNRDRDILREFLRKIGCGMLQESLWITPYNPKGLIGGFMEERELHGTILVSHMGRDGSIGDMDLPELLDEVYELSDLNQRYADFISICKEAGRSKSNLAFEFLSILNEDPQLPFELLSEDWVGDEAHKLFLKLTKSTI